MASIYDTISGWQSPVVYSKYSIASGQSDRYYYSLRDNNTNNNPNSTLQSNWDGYIIQNGIQVPFFFWKPSYSSSVDFSPRINRIKFGNGYEQRVPDGFNTNLITISLTFDARAEKEAVAILHFLTTMNGQIAFIYNVPEVLSKSSFNTKFICPNWTTTYNFYQNYTINATFEEVKA
jgi:phage-related protein